ncbi:MAG: metallophosphoesterase [Anaerolineae bacterium]
MTALLHNALGLALVVGLLAWLRRSTSVASVGASRGSITPVRAMGLVAVLMVLLGVGGLVSAVMLAGSVFAVAGRIAWTVFLHGPLFLIGVAVLWRHSVPVVALGAFAVAAFVALFALDAFLIEPHWLQVTRLTLPAPRLSQPVRIAVVADIQTDRPGRYEARGLERVMAESPDLILFAGDYVQVGPRSQGYAAEIEALRDLLIDANLAAPLGIYAVAGNVDRAGEWAALFAGLPVTVAAETTRYDLGPLVLTALSRQDSFQTYTTVEGEDVYHIVLGHSPNFSLGAVEADLLIAGHTHGGQVRLPLIGPLLTLSSVPRAWAAGVTGIALGKTLIVSRGIGVERAGAPQLRFCCRPELIVIDLVSEDTEL